jgi:lipopolysaccharide export system permease protein
MKLQEAAFTEISKGLVVYVNKVSGHDLSQVMLTDSRNPKAEVSILAEKGKLIATARGLSIVMTNGSLQSREQNLTIGTFDAFDMDLNVADKSGESVFKVRRISTWDLLKSVTRQESQKQHKLVLSEICTRFLSPVMNLILAILCAAILLRSSLLRRRASLAPAAAVAAMAGSMAIFMTAGNMITTLTELGVLMLAQFLVLAGMLYALFKK